MTGFRGRLAFLSNFYPATVRLDHQFYPTVEHAYQAAKSIDGDHRRRVLEVSTPAVAKQLGQRCVLRPDWSDALRVEVMRNPLDHKFAAGTPLAVQLLATGAEPLVESNPWGDTFWGVCRGVGRNQLGLLLMERRAAFRGMVA